MVIIPDTMTVEQTMDALHASRNYVYKLCDKGTLRYCKPSQRKILIYADDVMRLLRPVNQ